MQNSPIYHYNRDVLFSGCVASMLIGDAVRSHKKDINIATPQGSSISNMDKTANIAISLNGIKNGNYIYSYGSGSTNPKVYSNMLQIKLIQNGYSARSLEQRLSENSSKTTLDSLANEGVGIVLSDDLSLGSTSSYGSAATGGNYLDNGITSFTLKGIDPKDGSILFIASTKYGKAKKASDVTEDINEIYKDILAGSTEKYK